MIFHARLNVYILYIPSVLILYSSFITIVLYFELVFFLCIICIFAAIILKYADILPLHDQLNDNLHTCLP